MNRKAVAIAALLLGLLLPGTSPAQRESSASDARFIIGAVQAYAERGELVEIAKFMSSTFRYSFGGSLSKDEALAYYREHPEVLKELAMILAQGCRQTTLDNQPYYVCPPQFADPQVIYLHYRAGFRKQEDGRWEFDFFVAGD